MIRVVAVLNPFDVAASREVKDVPAGKSIRELVAEFSVKDGYDVEVSVDGSRLTVPDKMDFVPKSGSSVVFCAVPQGGGGKNPLALVAMLALAVAAPYLGAVGAQALYGAYAIAGTSVGLATSILSTGALIAGGLLLSSVFKPSSSSSGPADTSPTYSWNVENNAVAEGSVLPELFGTHRVTPPIIGHYVETVGDRQFLNLLLAVAGHQLDSIGSVRFNETDIEDMGTVTEDDVTLSIVTTEVRLGTVDQPVLQGFADTRIDTQVGARITASDWTTRTTAGNSVEGFAVVIGCPKGLFYANDDGGMDIQIAKIEIQYSVHDADDWKPGQVYSNEDYTIVTGRWSAGYYSQLGWIEVEEGTEVPGDHTDGDIHTPTIWMIGSGTVRPAVIWRWLLSGTTIVRAGSDYDNFAIISEATVSPIHRSYFQERLTPGRYDIRCRLVSALPEGPRYGTDVYFNSIQEIIYDDFRYPGVSLLTVRALATDQLSGAIPRVDCLATRLRVPVLWSPTEYKFPLASNPAWACYHLLHQARYKGTGSEADPDNYDVIGVPADRIDLASFKSWAGWCDNPAGDGSLAPNTGNIYFDTAMSLRKALDIAGACGRGVVTQIGSKFTCIVDRPEQTPVQRFLLTPGNIVAESFAEEFLPQENRANAVEVTYFDATEDYSRQSVEVYAADYDTTDREVNKASVTMIGVTSRQKAIDYARFLLNSNRYLTNTVSIEADVDSIACIPGDVIEISHDVPQWGYGGRVVSATASGVTLDRPVTLAAATTYNIMVKHQDDDAREIRVVADAPGTYTTLSTTVAWSKIPAAHTLYSVGEVDHVVKEFRVLRIGTGQDLRRKISAIEYLQEVFEDGAVIPPPESDSDLLMVSNLEAAEVYRGGSSTRVYLTWRGYALFWNVFIGRPLPLNHPFAGAGSMPPELLGIALNPYYEITGLDYGVNYLFWVSSTDVATDGEMVTIQLRGKIDPPGDVPSITVTELDQDYAVRIEWGAVTDFDLWGYELRVEAISEPYPYPNFSANWTTAEMLFKGNARNFTWTYKTISAYCFHVRAVDVFGNYSETSATAIMDIGVPDQPEGSYAFSGPNAVLSWTIPGSSFAIDHYDISYGSAYGTATPVGNTKGTTFSVNVTWGGTRRYWVTAVDVAGNEGTPEFIDVAVISPGPIVALTPQVIDNNVLLYWIAPTTGSLPIAYYEVSRGESYQTSVSVGTVQGTFSTIFETASGNYIYWVAAMDTAGNTGTATAIPASVNQPPDYVLLQSWADDFSGTKVSALLDGGVLYAPINITETYQEHFVNNSFDSPWEQVVSDFPAWIMPVPTTATYTRVFDFGSLITPLTKITLEVSRDDSKEWGTTTITPSIEVGTDGVNWGTPIVAYSALESGFRYVRVILTFSGADNDDIAAVGNLLLKLDLKMITDSGRVEVTTNGIQVDFNISFIDIVSITVTGEGTTVPLIAIYDFTDAPNPTHFHIYLFNAAGADASGSGVYASWTARGV